MHYDVVIIGGGINGVGTAQAVVSAGYSCLLIEKTALAAETSRSSSKLIHGGLRYLESFEFSLVKESLYERSLLLKLAPDLVKLTPFHIPIYKETTRQSLTIRAGLSLYALLGGLKKENLFSRIAQSKWPELDGLKTEGLKNVFSYFDAQTDDAALTKAVMKSALDLGAEIACPAKMIDANINDIGCEVEYQLDGKTQAVSCDCIVNASGPWVNTVNEQITGHHPSMPVDFVQGAHLVLKEPAVKSCYYLESPTDNRAVFLLPWKNGSLLGTTETLFNDDLSKIQVLKSEEEYLLSAAHHYFPKKSFQVTERMAGLRVLPKASNNIFKRSREISFLTDNESKPRLLSIYGGKLTVYRSTAQKVLTILKRTLSEKVAIADTKKLILTATQ